MFGLEQPIRESTRTADLPACPTSVPGCQSRALPVQRPDSPCASSNCLSGTPPTFPSNYLTLPPHPPPLALLSAGDFFLLRVKTVQDKDRACGGVRAQSWPLGVAVPQTSSPFRSHCWHSEIRLCHLPAGMTTRPHTHTHTLQPSGRGNSSRKAICCPPRCYGNCADTDSCAGELLSVMLEVRNQQRVIRISCYSPVLLITIQHWFIYTSKASVLCKAHLQTFFINPSLNL